MRYGSWRRTVGSARFACWGRGSRGTARAGRTPPPPFRSLVPQAPVVVERLFERALAKAPAQRFQSAIEMGEAFRHAFGIPDTPAWRAQGEIAQVARLGPPKEGARAQKMATLRQVVAHAYRTQPMPQRPVPRPPF